MGPAISVLTTAGMICTGACPDAASKSTFGAAYLATFLIGVLPTNKNDAGMLVTTTSVDTWRVNTPLCAQAEISADAALSEGVGGQHPRRAVGQP